MDDPEQVTEQQTAAAVQAKPVVKKKVTSSLTISENELNAEVGTKEESSVKKSKQAAKKKTAPAKKATPSATNGSKKQSTIGKPRVTRLITDAGLLKAPGDAPQYVRSMIAGAQKLKVGDVRTYTGKTKAAAGKQATVVGFGTDGGVHFDIAGKRYGGSPFSLGVQRIPSSGSGTKKTAAKKK